MYPLTGTFLWLTLGFRQKHATVFCHDFLQKSMTFNNFAISAVTGNDHNYAWRNQTKEESIHRRILKKHRKNQLKNALKSKKCGHIKTFDYTKTLSFLIKD